MIWLPTGLLLVCLTFWPPQGVSPASELSFPFTQVWSYLRADTLRYIPAVTDDQAVYTLLTGGHILALRLSTGEQMWEVHQEGEFTAAPQIDERALYVAAEIPSNAGPSARGRLSAIDKRTGDLRWQRSFDERLTSLTHTPGAGVPGLPQLFVGTETGRLIAFGRSTQEPAWQFRAAGAVRGYVTQEASVIYFGCDEGQVYALDAKTGTERWRFKANGAVRSRLEVGRGRLFFGSFDGNVYCLEKETGKRLWKVRTGAAIQAKPVLVSDLLIAPSYDNFVYALDPDSGSIRWKVRLSGRIMADPIVRGSAILVSVIRDHRVVVLRAEDGQQVNSLDVGAGVDIVAPPVMSRRTLILITEQGVIAARPVKPVVSDQSSVISPHQPATVYRSPITVH